MEWLIRDNRTAEKVICIHSLTQTNLKLSAIIPDIYFLLCSAIE